MIELRDFVRESLKQIVEGVSEAQEEVRGRGRDAMSQPYIVPSHHSTPSLSYGYTVVSFDVQVGAREGEQVTGGMGVFVPAIAVGARSASQEEAHRYSRIQFDVSLRLPAMKIPTAEDRP